MCEPQTLHRDHTLGTRKLLMLAASFEHPLRTTFIAGSHLAPVDDSFARSAGGARTVLFDGFVRHAGGAWYGNTVDNNRIFVNIMHPLHEEEIRTHYKKEGSSVKRRSFVQLNL
jgi:hypothetical protein